MMKPLWVGAMALACACGKSGGSEKKAPEPKGGSATTTSHDAAPPALDKVGAEVAVQVVELGPTAGSEKDEREGSIAIAPDGHPVIAFQRGLEVHVEEWMDGQWWDWPIGSACNQMQLPSVAVAADGAILVTGRLGSTLDPPDLCVASFAKGRWSQVGETLHLKSFGGARLVTTADGPVLVAFSDVISAWILDGAQWKAFPTHPLGGDSAESSVGVAATPDGIVVGWLPFDGNKVTAQVSRLATKTGTWTDLPSPEEHVANNPHLSLAASTSGAIFWTLGADVQRLAATGSAWQSLGDGELPMCPDSYGLCKKLLTGGLEDRVTQLKDPNALLLQRHDGTQWQPLGAGLGERHRLDAAATSPDGTIFVLWHPLAENGADAELPMQVTQIKPS